MSPVTTVPARLLLSAPFVSGGLEALKDPEVLISVAERLQVPLPSAMVRLSASSMVVGGLTLAFGVAPRATAAGLTLTLLGATVTVHAFWSEEEAPARIAHRRMFIQNMALVGALILAANPPGSLSDRDQGGASPSAGNGIFKRLEHRRHGPQRS